MQGNVILIFKLLGNRVCNKMKMKKVILNLRGLLFVAILNPFQQIICGIVKKLLWKGKIFKMMQCLSYRFLSYLLLCDMCIIFDTCLIYLNIFSRFLIPTTAVQDSNPKPPNIFASLILSFICLIPEFLIFLYYNVFILVILWCIIF